MALAAAFEVDAIALTLDSRVEAKKLAHEKRHKIRDAMRVGFLINLASYVFGLLVFTGISVSDGAPGFSMLIPAVWWGVGVAGFGLAALIIEITAHYQDKADAVE